MKRFIEVSFDPSQCRRELTEFGELLSSRADLRERSEIQKFFRERKQLSAFLGTYAPQVGPANLLAFEFFIFGDFAADVVLGNRERGAFCLIEMEDALPASIFASLKGKATKEWSRRFEHGFSQLVDWFYALDDLKATARFAQDFGHGHASFFGILVIGRSGALSAEDRSRLKWRAERVLVNSNYVNCLTFDDLYDHLVWRMTHYPDFTEET